MGLRYDDKSTVRRDGAAHIAPAPGEERATLVLYHRDGASAISLSRDVPVVVGRSAPSDVTLADPSLSRQHARFTWTEQGIEVQDLQSTNGTLVNGKSVEHAVITAKDEVTIGSVIGSTQHLGTADGSIPGIEGHDTLVARLDEELLRARSFDRSLSLVMVGAAEGQAEGMSRWVMRLRQLLRPVDRMGLYGPGTVLVILPELDPEQARSLAQRFIDQTSKGEPRLRCGVAGFPDAGTSSGQMLSSVRRALQSTSKRSPVASAASRSGRAAPKDTLVAESPAMQELLARVGKVADAHFPVLLLGETGSGKEVLARTMHEQSARRDKPLLCVNCGAIPHTLLESTLFGHERGAFTGADKSTAGIFEQADGGTVLLDEIGELSFSAQAALLRVLETKAVTRVGGSQSIEVDVRVLAATHRDLDAMCREGSFRSDLLFRLNAEILRIPPLRERRADIEPLAELFLEAANKANRCRVRSIDSQAMRLLQRYEWPGNVRELRNVIERAVVLASEDHITAEDLSERVRGAESEPPSMDEDPEGAPDFNAQMKRYEKQLIVQALRSTGGNQTQAARKLGMPLRTLVRKVREYDLR